MRDRDLNGPDDYLSKAEEAREIDDVYDRAQRFGDLLEWATNDRRLARIATDGSADVIATLRANAARSITELDDYRVGSNNPERTQIDVETLAKRLEEIRLGRTDPKA